MYGVVDALSTRRKRFQGACVGQTLRQRRNHRRKSWQNQVRLAPFLKLLASGLFYPATTTQAAVPSSAGAPAAALPPGLRHTPVARWTVILFLSVVAVASNPSIRPDVGALVRKSDASTLRVRTASEA